MAIIQFCFKINYHALYDEQMVIVGDNQQFGNWDVNNGIKLAWSQGDFWMQEFEFEYENHSVFKKIEYKYVLCSKKADLLIPIRWESGANRQINSIRTKKSTSILTFNDLWNFRKISLRIKNSFVSEPQISLYMVMFDDAHKQVVKKMKYIQKNQNISFWQKKFYVDLSQNVFKYCFLAFDKKSQKIFWDRQQVRKLNLSDFFITKEFHQKNYFHFYDFEFDNKFSINEINANMIIGPYPQNEKEIEILAKKGVKAVLNLQTREDMNSRAINYQDLKSLYHQKGIFFINYQICDNFADLTDKALGGADLLNRMIQKFQKVYIHCTWGVFRAPSIVAAYLYVNLNYSFQKALETLKVKRPEANPSSRCLANALLSKYEDEQMFSYI